MRSGIELPPGNPGGELGGGGSPGDPGTGTSGGELGNGTVPSVPRSVTGCAARAALIVSITSRFGPPPDGRNDPSDRSQPIALMIPPIVTGSATSSLPGHRAPRRFYFRRIRRSAAIRRFAAADPLTSAPRRRRRETRAPAATDFRRRRRGAAATAFFFARRFRCVVRPPLRPVAFAKSC